MKAPILSLRTRLLIAAFPLCVTASPVAAQVPLVLTPVQAAYLQAENRRIEEVFVQKVMNVTGASREQVLRAIPAKGRITDRLARIYSALDRDLKVPLTDEQKGLIFAAEGERKLALKEVQSTAATR